MPKESPEKPVSEGFIHVENPDYFRVSGALVFDSVLSLRKISFPLVCSSTSPVFNLQQVTHVDSAGLALLVFWAREAHQREIPVRFESLSPQLMDIARICRLDWLIEDEDPIGLELRPK